MVYSAHTANVYDPSLGNLCHTTLNEKQKWVYTTSPEMLSDNTTGFLFGLGGAGDSRLELVLHNAKNTTMFTPASGAYIVFYTLNLFQHSKTLLRKLIHCVTQVSGWGKVSPWGDLYAMHCSIGNYGKESQVLWRHLLAVAFLQPQLTH